MYISIVVVAPGRLDLPWRRTAWACIILGQVTLKLWMVSKISKLDDVHTFKQDIIFTNELHIK